MNTVFGSGEYTLAGASSVNIDSTQFSSDVIRSLDSSSNKVAISSSGTISVTDGSSGQITQSNTNTQYFTKTLGANAKMTVTSASILEILLRPPLRAIPVLLAVLQALSLHLH